MSLDREELVARVLVALARNKSRGGPADAFAEDAVNYADALIARLRPATVAPVADAAPRPEWVRITSIPLGDDGRYPFAVGQVFKVAEWEDSAPRVIGPRREGITLSASGASIDPRHPGFATWEPCAAPAPSATAAKGGDTGTAAAMPDAPDPRRTVGAVVKGPSSDVEFIVVDFMTVRRVERDATGISAPPLECDTFVRWATRDECERHGIPYVARGRAPSPAASPAAYVPKPASAGAAAYVPQVGDVVRFRIYGKNDPGTGVVTGVGADAATIVAFGEDPTNDKPWCRYFRDCVYARPASAAERAAAGLDAPAKPAPAVDREAFTTLLDAVKWVLNDAAFKAPEQMGEVAERWVARLVRAIGSLPPSLTKGGAS